MTKHQSDKTKLILDFIQLNPLSSSKEIHEGIDVAVGYATVKRILQKLIYENLITLEGQAKATKYKVSNAYVLIHPTDVDEYFKKEIDDREIKRNYNFELINETFAQVSLFSAEEKEHLNQLQKKYKQNIAKLSKQEYKKELERLAIDLSWKSSQIEGNTYSLLETERLINEKEKASGKTKEEAIMLLNHKSALDFVIANPKFISPLTISVIEDIHSVLVKGLGITRNLRRRRVGISGTNYKPLDNEFQIREALEQMCEVINKQKDIFSKALMILVLKSYIQPFADGNKRTARIISNAILMNNKYCPISFRTVDSIDYKKAMLIFYEQNNISAFKRIFIDQFEFAVNTYF